jgi:hypothetical protein
MLFAVNYPNPKEERMPCYTVQLTTVEFKAQHIELLLKALKALDVKFYQRTDNQIRINSIGKVLISITIDTERQQVTCEASAMPWINKIKQQYSLQAVTEAARKNKWIAKQLADKKLVLRRY